MLALFPVPYKDELLYSLCARYGRLMGHSSRKTTLLHLFGRTTVTAVVDLPTRLDALAEQLVPLGGPSADELIDQHTLFPFFAAFYSSQKKREVRAAMREEGHPHWLLGLMASRVPQIQALRYCPVCVNEERGRLGETYWHRSHQLPGVLVCKTHGVWLEESEVILPAPVSRQAFLPADKVVPRHVLARHIPEGGEREILVDLAQRASNLLKTPLSITPSELQSQYLNALAECQLATYSGQLHINKLEEALSEFIPTSMFKVFGLEGKITGWLLRLLRKPRVAAHTLHHLLLQAFLNLRLEGLNQVVLPFGEGPWPCLNRTSEHYMELCIQDVQVDFTVNAREPIGTFTCSCGFSYRRVGPDHVSDDRYRLDRMAAYGRVWEEALQRFWPDPTLSLRELSRRLGFDPQIVRKRAASLGLALPRPGGHVTVHPTRREVSVAPRMNCDSYRKVWQQTRLKYPTATTSQLRKCCPAAYIWLYRNDREWLAEQKPSSYRPKAAVPRVNWSKRDLLLSKKLRQAATNLTDREPAIRITVTRLGREIKQESLLSQHLGKLPLCRKVLEEVIETREKFALRRIQLVTKKLMLTGERIPHWKFVRLCGLRNDLLAMPEIAHALEQAWRKLLARYEVSAA